MAVYCKNIRLLYISAWMTGCTSTEKFLIEHYGGRYVGGKHESLDASLKLLKQNNLFCVTNIRNPYDSVVSCYFKERFLYYPEYVKTGRYPTWMSSETQQRCTLVGEADVTFEQYVLNRASGAWPNFIDDKRFDHYIAFEYLQSELDRMFMKLGIVNRHQLPHLNKSPLRDKDFRQYYTPQMKEVATECCKSYLLFTGYTFYGRPKLL
jgi:hypothetical protein